MGDVISLRCQMPVEQIKCIFLGAVNENAVVAWASPLVCCCGSLILLRKIKREDVVQLRYAGPMLRFPESLIPGMGSTLLIPGIPSLQDIFTSNHIHGSTAPLPPLLI